MLEKKRQKEAPESPSKYQRDNSGDRAQASSSTEGAMGRRRPRVNPSSMHSTTSFSSTRGSRELARDLAETALRDRRHREAHRVIKSLFPEKWTIQDVLGLEMERPQHEWPITYFLVSKHTETGHLGQVSFMGAMERDEASQAVAKEKWNFDPNALSLIQGEGLGRREHMFFMPTGYGVDYR